MISLPDTCQAEGQAVPLARVQVWVSEYRTWVSEAGSIQVTEPCHKPGHVWRAEGPHAPLLGWHSI